MCSICSHFSLYLFDYFIFFKLLRKTKTHRYSLFVDLREAELFCSTLLLIVEPKQDKKKKIHKNPFYSTKLNELSAAISWSKRISMTFFFFQHFSTFWRFCFSLSCEPGHRHNQLLAFFFPQRWLAKTKLQALPAESQQRTGSHCALSVA